jgi:hypothetical protein
LPNCFHDFEGVEVTVKNIRKDIVDLSNKIGFEGVDGNDVEDLLQLHREELTNEELIQLGAHLCQEEQEEEEEDEMPPKTSDMKKLGKRFAAVDVVTTILDENNPNLERSRQCKTRMDEAIQCYRVQYDSKKREAKQTSIRSFFRLSTSSSFQPQTSTSGISRYAISEDEDIDDPIEVYDSSSSSLS